MSRHLVTPIRIGVSAFVVVAMFAFRFVPAEDPPAKLPQQIKKASNLRDSCRRRQEQGRLPRWPREDGIPELRMPLTCQYQKARGR